MSDVTSFLDALATGSGGPLRFEEAVFDDLLLPPGAEVPAATFVGCRFGRLAMPRMRGPAWTFDRCDFGGDIDLSGARIEGEIRLRGCESAGCVSFPGASASAVRVEDSIFRGRLDGRNLATGRLVLSGVALTGMDLSDAEIGAAAGDAIAPVLHWRGVKCEGDCTFDSAEFHGEARLEDVRCREMGFKGAGLHGGLALLRVATTGDLVLEEARGAKWLDATGVDVGGDLRLRYGRLTGVDFSGAHVTGRLDATRARVTGELLLTGASAAEVVLSDAEVDIAELSRLEVSRSLIARRLRVPGADRDVGALKVAGSSVAGDLAMRDATVRSGHAVDFTGTRVAGTFDLSDARLAAPAVELRRGSAGDLAARGARFEPDRNGPACLASFRGAAVRGGLDLLDATFDTVDLADVRADRVTLAWEQVRGRVRTPFEPAGPGRAPDRERGRNRDLSNQYAWLIKVFEGQGRYEDQDEAYLHHRRHARMARRRPVRDFLEWLLVDAGIAYGMRPWRVALVAATAIVAFAALFFGVLPTEFLFDQELAESVNGSGAATSGVPGLMTALHALLYSADCFFSFGIASTRPAYTSAAGLAVVAEGLLGLVVTTTFVGTVIRKFIRMG